MQMRFFHFVIMYNNGYMNDEARAQKQKYRHDFSPQCHFKNAAGSAVGRRLVFSEWANTDSSAWTNRLVSLWLV